MQQGSGKCVAVVVTYNKLDYLKECLNRLQKCRQFLQKIVVVNNASTDGTRDYLMELSTAESLIDVLNEKENLGGAAGFNAGIKKAMEFDADTIWVMDDDCQVEPSTVDELQRAASSLVADGVEWGVLASNVRWTDGGPAVMNIPKTVATWNDRAETNLIRIEHSSFVSMYINTSMVKKFGYPIKDFFIWGDDVEYSYRIASKYPSYCVMSSEVVHNMVANAKVDIMTDSANRVPRYFYDVRNNFFISKRIGKKETLRFVYGFLKKIIRVSFHGQARAKKVRVLLRGFLAGLMFNPTVEKFQ